MDSTTFSMHFRSIASLKSGDLKTSSGVHLSIEEKTPTRVSMPFNLSPMQLTQDKKPNFKPDDFTSKLNSGSESNDMTLVVVGDYEKYNYGKLLPDMNLFLKEGDHDTHMASHTSVLKSPIKAGKQSLENTEHGPDLVGFTYGQDNKMEGITSPGEPLRVVSVKHTGMGVADDGSKLFPSKQIVFGDLANTSESQNTRSLTPNQSFQGTLTAKETMKDAFGYNSSLESLATSHGTLSNTRDIVSQLDNFSEMENKSPLIGSLTHHIDKSTNTLSNGASLFKSPGTVTPSHNRASAFPRTGSLQHGDSVSILQRSISKLDMLHTSPFSAALSANLESSISRTSAGVSKSGRGHVGGLGERISNTRLSTPLNVTGSNIEEMVHDRKDYPPEIFSKSETKENPTTLSNDLEHENYRSVFRGSDISMGRMNTLIVLNGRGDEISCQKNLADEFGKSPSNKDLCSVSHNNNPLHPEDVQYSSANRLSGADVSSVERKRKTEVVAIEKNAKIKRSSNLDLELLSDREMSNFDPNLIHTTFFEEIKILSHSAEKMNLHAIDRLVDIISQLQRSKTYQLLSDQIQNRSSDIRQKRAAETKLLLCKLVHEHAKLQLLHVKRERKKRQSLASRIQESEVLKLKLDQLSQISLDIQAYNRQPLANEDIQEFQGQGDNDEVNSMKQTLEDMDTRISNLTKSFHSSLTMKGAPSPDETIAFVNDHLLKRARCQIMRRDLQLWVVEDLKSRKDHHIVLLNYLDLVSQRFTVTSGVVRSMSVSNTLNGIIIKKKFKDMDALTAFGFVIDSGPVQKSVGATSLSQETQVTGHLLGNLVDVMQEIQAARIELMNLVYARFCRPLEGSLNLELHFFDPNSRKSATVTLNSSCLKRGIYPSEIIAWQIDIPIVESQHSSTQKLSAEIAAALQDLGEGFYRILRVCRCISHLVSLQDKK